MSRSWELFLQDMLEAARKIIRYIGSRQVEDFVADEMAYDATLRNLEILGEAERKSSITFARLPSGRRSSSCGGLI